MTFQYDAAGALARIKADLSRRPESQKSEVIPAKLANPANPPLEANPALAGLAGLAASTSNLRTSGHAAQAVSPPTESQKPEGTPAKLANPAKAGSTAPDGLAGLAGLAGVHADFHAGDHTIKAVSSPVEDQKSARAPAKVAKAANPFPVTPLAVGSENDLVAARALRQPTQPWEPADWQAFFGEKAAISEFDHGMSRQQAEEHALNHCVSKWLYEHPMDSDANDGCVVCGVADRANDPLLAVGLGGGLVWAHRECAPAWRAGRIAEAIRALTALGVTGSKDSST